MPQTPLTSYLDPQTLASISPLELRARMIVEGLMTGMHRSPYFGYSIEFAQHRQYAPGDDIRHLDWKVFGRTDKLYLKQYRKETNLDLFLLVDASGSMAYGGTNNFGKKNALQWSKYDYAASMAAGLAYLAQRQQDRVGLALFADQVLSMTRLSDAQGHWRSIVESLDSVRASDTAAKGKRQGDSAPQEQVRSTDLGRLFDQVTAKLVRRSLVVLVSDLFDEPESYERGLAKLRHRRHDVIVLQTLDATELSFPYRNPSQFIGLENEGRLNLDPAALRDAYLKALGQHLQKMEQITRRFGFDYLLIDTSTDLAPALSHFLARRAMFINRIGSA
jgi:uncharacterized protein (DUF58 family)